MQQCLGFFFKVKSQSKQYVYFHLMDAFSEHFILAQVQLSHFLGVKKWQNHQERVNKKRADFAFALPNWDGAAT